MKGSLYLIGGGELRKGETAPIDDAIKASAPKGSTLVFFGTAAGDNLDYINSVNDVFNNHFNIIAPTEKNGFEFACSAISKASIIYLGGGETHLLLTLFEKWNLVETLRGAWNNGTHIVGMSAGAQALSAWYIHEEAGFMELRRGWSFLPITLLVHARPDSVARARKPWEENTNLRAYPLVAIEEKAALCVTPTTTQKIGSGNVWQTASN